MYPPRRYNECLRWYLYRIACLVASVCISSVEATLGVPQDARPGVSSATGENPPAISIMLPFPISK